MRALPHHEQEERRVLPEVWRVLDGVSRRRKPILDLDGLLRQPEFSPSEQQCKATHQAQQLERKGSWERSKCQGKECWQRIQHQGQQWEKFLFALCLCANVQCYDALAHLGLRAIPTSSIDSYCAAATGQPIHSGIGLGAQKSVSREFVDSFGDSGGHGRPWKRSKFLALARLPKTFTPLPQLWDVPGRHIKRLTMPDPS